MTNKKKVAAAFLCIFAALICMCATILNNDTQTEPYGEHKRIAENLISTIQTDNEEFFERITSDKIIKHYEGDSIKTKADVFKDITLKLENDFGSGYSLKLKNSDSYVTEKLFSTEVSVICIGTAEGDVSSGEFGFGLIMSDDLILDITYYGKEQLDALTSESETTEQNTTQEESTTVISKYLWEY